MGKVERKMRFSQTGWKLIQEEAREQGVSATEFVRTAATVYATYLRTLREGRNESLDEVVRRLRDP